MKNLVVSTIERQEEELEKALTGIKSQITLEIEQYEGKGCKLTHMSHSVSPIMGERRYGRDMIPCIAGYLATAILIFEK